MWNGIRQAPWGPAGSPGLTAMEMPILAPGAGANGVCRPPASGMFAIVPFDVSSFVVGVAVVAPATPAANRLPARRAMRIASIIVARHE
jgi:hypothetical protein